MFGVANGVLAFVPRMIESGEPGVDRQHVVGRRRHRAGAVRVGVRREQGRDQLLHRGARAPARSTTAPTLRAAVFYPSGGLLDTGLWTAARNRPAELAREREHAPGPVADVRRVPRAAAPRMGTNADVADLGELGRFVVAEVKDGSFVIGHNLDEAGALLHARADAIAQGAAAAAPQPLDPIARSDDLAGVAVGERRERRERQRLVPVRDGRDVVLEWR